MPHLETGKIYPYYVPGLYEDYLKCPENSGEADILRKKIRVNIGDDDTLFKLLHSESNLAPGKSENHQVSTMETIDSFLEKFAPPKKAAGYLQEEPGGNEEKTFNSDVLSQLIKNQRYDEAIEIIERQNLNNTQKNIYFAHQIRFLRKLMAIEKHKQKAAKQFIKR